VLYERALIAERDDRAAQKGELLQRLALHDVGGGRRERWDAYARVSIDSDPRGAGVSIGRYVVAADGTRPLDAPRDLGETPIPTTAMEPGSYLVTVRGEGRALVRYPIRLGRGERVELALDLPPVAAVPEGFVYVPPGRFLFGSADPEPQRKNFFRATPIHEVTTEAYLIAQYETTYGDWLEFLRALPTEQRERYVPRVGGGLAGTLDLRELPDGRWQIVLQPTTEKYIAAEGERVHYRGRDRNATQDWLRMPVAAVTWDDAIAYTRWMETSGRILGARPCTEHEWERAARGADDRVFPVGDALAPTDANLDESYGKGPRAFGPDEVGLNASSGTPFGVYDMAGNVWEWTSSSLAQATYVLRGGGYAYDLTASSSINRQVGPPSLRDLGVGLRVCVAYPHKTR
jgi:formylglycine-generating enzyme required for sulfatase activity